MEITTCRLSKLLGLVSACRKALLQQLQLDSFVLGMACSSSSVHSWCMLLSSCSIRLVAIDLVLPQAFDSVQHSLLHLRH